MTDDQRDYEEERYNRLLLETGGDLDLPTQTHCEDFPCCGHEDGDCFGQKYGSDEDIKRRVYERMDEDDDWPNEGEE